MEMESQFIAGFCKILSSFCNHVQSTSQALHDSVHRRPLPLDSASSTFIQSLNRRISSTNPDLNHLHSMLLETISFQELLAHCNQLYQKNQAHLLQLSDHLHMFGYAPGPDDEDQETLGFSTPLAIDSEVPSPENATNQLSMSSPSVSAAAAASASLRKRFEEDPLFDDSMCLQDLGLSDISLATLAAGVNDELSSPKMLIELLSCENEQPLAEESKATENFPRRSGEINDALKSIGSIGKCTIKITKDHYDELPSYMKSLASWEDLQVVVEKMNLILCKQDRSAEGYSFNPDDIASLELGSKGRSYLLMLLRMNRLVVETADGSISYRVII